MQWLGFRASDRERETDERELMRSSKAEKDQEGDNVDAFRDTHTEEAKPGSRSHIKWHVRGNTLDPLMEAGKVCSLGSMSHTLYDAGGEYRRDM